MTRVPFLIFVAVILAFAWVTDVQAASRGISIDLRTSESVDAPVAGTVELYSESYALVIGNDDYNNGWPKLSNAIKDAELITAELEKKGFDVELHKNLASAELSTVFKRFFILKGDNPSARLFIWFAGHGATVDGEGYLIPIDAPTPNANGAEFKFASVALRDFGTYMRQATSKHVYAVFDSCFAGTVFSSQRALPPAAITRATTMPVRQFLTSGDADQTVSDDGSFRELFIRAIEGDERADANGDGYVTASELGMFLGDRVTNLTQSMQTPRFGKLRDKNFDRGDFVFVLPEGVVANALRANDTGASNANNAEITFWNSIKDASSVSQFDAYLAQYPGGSFAALAMVKKSEIESRLAKERARADAKKNFKVTFINQDMQAAKVANVRETPFPTADRVAQLEEGALVWAVGETRTDGGTWYKVARDGVELGFVYAPLLVAVDMADAVVSVEPLAFEEEETAAAPVSAGERLSFLVEDLLQEVTPPAAEAELVASRGLPPAESVEEVVEEAVEVATLTDELSTYAKRYISSARRGSSKAQLSLGYMYENGEHVKVDKLEAVKWYKEAAGNGEVDAMISLALMYENGDGIGGKDMAQAAEWYRKAADSGHADAQQALAYLYEMGDGVTKNLTEAAKLYELAAQQGRVAAQNNLGRLYQLGVGVPRDLDQAIFWYEKAAAQGSEAAKGNLAKLIPDN